MRALAVVLLASLPAIAERTVEQRDVAIPMRDGKSLAADVYLPAKVTLHFDCCELRLPVAKE